MSLAPLQRTPEGPGSRQFIVCDYVAEYRAVIPLVIRPSDIVLEIGCAQGVTTGRLSEYAFHTIGIDYKQHCVEISRGNFPHIRFELMDGFNLGGVLKLLEEGNDETLERKLRAWQAEREATAKGAGEGGDSGCTAAAAASPPAAAAVVPGAGEVPDRTEGREKGEGNQVEAERDAMPPMIERKFSKVFMDLSGSRQPQLVLELARRYQKVIQPELIVVKNEPLKRFLSQTQLFDPSWLPERERQALQDAEKEEGDGGESEGSIGLSGQTKKEIKLGRRARRKARRKEKEEREAEQQKEQGQQSSAQSNLEPS
uniref:Methyltransferase domain-containing protein n=1 Tax=Chromera velia CCMP2878 TaxID=1169474 RepID=A0A0G4FLL3_9ALVE|eukprot:Cvel_17645.t1-p1 / transcript=Cvel_17645.t1 / gene=Cvel_17645 / organism=Chromera_velia_CCMP2878 / gene_product=hypothetical protein / transcript_product=hypothetical protein / location=Cvel_scaffold1421:9897-12899(-) / protein_length=312 / sequence_SO=supercontig / SO=protein_coding / is_pseudo=false